MLVVHGGNDTIVPVTLGERLYGLISAPKCFARIAGAGHKDLGAQAVAAAKTVRRRAMTRQSRVRQETGKELRVQSWKSL